MEENFLKGGEGDNMQAKLTQTFVNSVSPSDKLLRIRDTNTKGLVLFVNAGGKKTYFIDYKRLNGKRADHKIGDASLFTLAEARENAREFLASIERGEDPSQPEEKLLFGDFIKDIYEPWVIENRKSGDSTAYFLKSYFSFLSDTPVEEITIAQIERWRSKRRKEGAKNSSVNRFTTSLQAALNWAVKRNIIASNPIARLERLSEEDSEAKVRYLSDLERERLMTALDEREGEIRRGRDSHNGWLTERGMAAMPKLKEGGFADHLKPVVLLALSTGIRRNSLFSLEWRDVDLDNRTVLVRAATAKSGKQYFVPLNDLAFEVVAKWHRQCPKTSPGSLVFPSPQTGKKMNNCNTAWEHLLKKAEITDFRWHDMRHDFASQLVMSGVDLNTVRELMGHADLKMTLRYAHLAPEKKLQAVKVLDKKTSLSRAV